MEVPLALAFVGGVDPAGVAFLFTNCVHRSSSDAAEAITDTSTPAWLTALTLSVPNDSASLATEGLERLTPDRAAVAKALLTLPPQKGKVSAEVQSVCPSHLHAIGLGFAVSLPVPSARNRVRVCSQSVRPICTQ